MSRSDNHQINIRVNEVQYAKIQVSARIMGLSVSKYCKHLVMQSKLRDPKFSDEEYHQLIVNLSRIGNNINQMARRLNQADSEIASEELAMLNTTLSKLDDEVTMVWQQLR
ncbi:plasmid mobilization protein [Limosilactobacillus fermentum]|jgi:hypothetical protein|uniref:plasmid mobilization protein n=1 Tax=Limosilactobacillus fermentum TaxID=1613 RepID=UPI0027B8C322|nr:plasmid mobilization relaxosome protein MobC [Limosilactobacillus fermentum]MCF0119254.1 plasmid mobilization relaxosome protein MobC [Limosilactobacillus mucosae]WLW44765.1 plasmid mobilization relaxosome protein MobC [Limosilactobacillus fermentum]